MTKKAKAVKLLALSSEHLWKWRALDAELRAAQSELEHVTRSAQALVGKYPDLEALLQRKVTLAGSIAVAKTQYLGIQHEIEGALGISLAEHSIDVDTGRLYTLTADGTPAPVKSKPHRKRK